MSETLIRVQGIWQQMPYYNDDSSGYCTVFEEETDDRENSDDSEGSNISTHIKDAYFAPPPEKQEGGARILSYSSMHN